MTNKGLDPNFHDSGTGGMDLMIKSHPKRNKSIDFKEHTLNTTLFHGTFDVFYDHIIDLFSSHIFLICTMQPFIIFNLTILLYLNKIEMTLKVRQRSMHFKAQGHSQVQGHSSRPRSN